MVTGDHAVTAHAVAEGLDIPHEDDAIALGADLDAAGPAELPRLVLERTILARTRREQKYVSTPLCATPARSSR